VKKLLLAGVAALSLLLAAPPWPVPASSTAAALPGIAGARRGVGDENDTAAGAPAERALAVSRLYAL